MTVLCAVVGVVVTCIVKWYNYSNSTYMPGSQIHVINCFVNSVIVYTLGECIALWGEPNELSIQHHVYIFIQYVDS